jgi:mono/diheme cytochrome c family protein
VKGGAALKFFFGVIVGVALAVVAVGVYFVTGMAPAAATDPPMPFEKLIARTALDAHIARATEQQSPVPADEKDLLAGADEYNMDCAGCHGLPGQKDKPAIAKGMYPPPPQLLHSLGNGRGDGSVWETYWKVENGIRLTGMPAFKGFVPETAIWQVSELLANRNALPESVKKELAPTPAAMK